mmetsp:Transcript_30848/g.76731  ORF Transcript_30848/g.76731 Transcript_30848/m.76731 type:complete len:261 (-) Transcript_30848:1538-2320(-)
MRRDSWRSVPITCRPPMDTTSTFSALVTRLNSSSTLLNAARSLSAAASSVGAFSHANDSRSSASSASRDRSPHAAAAASTASFSCFSASGDRSQGNNPSFTFHLAAETPPRALLFFFSKAMSPSTGATTRGIRVSRILSRARNSALPPRRMSVPRPAMLVAMVTAPLRPLCATISLSRSTFSGLALSSSKGMPSSVSSAPMASLRSTLVVPTSTGRPFLCMRAISRRTAVHLPCSERNTTSCPSSRLTSRFVGTTCTCSS